MLSLNALSVLRQNFKIKLTPEFNEFSKLVTRLLFNELDMDWHGLKLHNVTCIPLTGLDLNPFDDTWLIGSEITLKATASLDIPRRLKSAGTLRIRVVYPNLNSTPRLNDVVNKRDDFASHLDLLSKAAGQIDITYCNWQRG